MSPAVALAAVGLFLFAPSAPAAPPANDDFADAEALSSVLPDEAAGSTVEATPEAGEPTPAGEAFAASGRTVWFEWEAASTGFVTLSTCGSGVGNVIGVYTGAALGGLTEVAGKFPSQGPDCTTFRGDAVTFKAIAGMTYRVLVEGRASFPEEENFAQGPFVLKVETTQLPPNDDFADATVLEGKILDNGIYAAGGESFTWNAGKESGEPQHAGNPGGASVWFAWTAPFTDDATVSGCGRFASLLGVYTGGAVGALSHVASSSNRCAIVSFPVTAGVTYRIALDGELDPGSGEAQMGVVWTNVVRGIYPSPPPTPPSSGPFAEPPFGPYWPNTTIRRRTVRHAKRRATFAFRSSEPDSKFRCALDAGEFKPCPSPRTYRNLAPGRHVFRVVAIDAASNMDPSPAVARFRIARSTPTQKRREGGVPLLG